MVSVGLLAFGFRAIVVGEFGRALFERELVVVRGAVVGGLVRLSGSLSFFVFACTCSWWLVGFGRPLLGGCVVVCVKWLS